jgi:hypothetical protein
MRVPGDATRNKKVESFDFEGLVTAFTASGLTTWALTNALTAQPVSGSDTAALAVTCPTDMGVSEISLTSRSRQRRGSWRMLRSVRALSPCRRWGAFRILLRG